MVKLSPFLLTIALLICACDPAPSTAAVPKGNRVFSLDMADMALGKTYEDNRAKAASLKASATTLSLQWNAIETAPHVYADPGNAPATANAYFPAHGMRLSLTIRSVDTVAIPIPGDLVSLQIGNEFEPGLYRLPANPGAAKL